MPTCMICGKWIDDGRTKFVGKRCECKKEYTNPDGSTELRFIIEPVTRLKAPFKSNNVVHKLDEYLLHHQEGYPLCSPLGGYVHNASQQWKDVTCKACLKKRKV